MRLIHPSLFWRKVRLATILNTFQSTLVNFKYVSSQWRKNCEEERLLGVSLLLVLWTVKYTNGKEVMVE